MVEVTFEEWEKDKIVEEYWQPAKRLVETYAAFERAKTRFRGQPITDEQRTKIRQLIKEKAEAQGEWKDIKQHEEMMKIVVDAFPEDAA